MGNYVMARMIDQTPDKSGEAGFFPSSRLCMEWLEFALRDFIELKREGVPQ